MKKTIKLRTAIVNALKSVHPRVYYEHAPESAQYPYLVYNLPNSNDRGDLEQFVLDVDGWDTPVDLDTTPLETLMANVDQVLDHRVITVDDLSVVIYRDRRLTLDDDDKRIRRRKNIYEVRVITERRRYHGW